MEKWLNEGKLDCSEDVGDLVKAYDTNLALTIYLRAQAPHKVVQCYAETGQFEQMIAYAKNANFQPDYLFQLRQVLRIDPALGLTFAKLLVSEGDRGQPLLDINQVARFCAKRASRKCSRSWTASLRPTPWSSARCSSSRRSPRIASRKGICRHACSR